MEAPAPARQSSVGWLVAATLALCGTLGCEDREPLDAVHQPSLDALFTLLPDSREREQFERATWQLWGALESHGCRSCHGAEGAPGWHAAKMPYWSYFTSDLISFLRFDPREGNNLRGVHYYDLLSGRDPNLQMPPLREGQAATPTDSDLLDRLSVNDSNEAVRQLQSQGIIAAQDRLRHALGTQLVFVNDRGVCFDRRNTGADAYADSLCEPLTALIDLIRTRTDNFGDLEAWNSTVETARRANHYDSREGEIRTFVEALGAVPGQLHGDSFVGPSNERLVFRFGEGWTVSFFTKPAPDDSAIGLTATNMQEGTRFRPAILNLRDWERPVRYADCVRYDPIFSPDYNDTHGTGFAMGGRGASSNSSFDKYFSFYVPLSNLDLPGVNAVSCRGEDYPPVRDWLLNGISGYGTIARIADANAVNAAWAPYVGDYVVMGKRWAWTVVRPTLNADGRTIDITSPTNRRVNQAICSNLWSNNASSGVSLSSPDAMISPDGRFISLRRTSDLATLVVSTRDCQVSHVVPTPSGGVLRGGKGSFSYDGRYLTVHAFGENGEDMDRAIIAQDGRIVDYANETVANVFIYDLVTRKTVQITNYGFGSNERRFVGLFPSFNGDASRLYFHRHQRNARSSEIVFIPNPLEAFQ